MLELCYARLESGLLNILTRTKETNCHSYRVISLSSLAGQVFFRVLLPRLQVITNILIMSIYCLFTAAKNIKETRCLGSVELVAKKPPQPSATNCKRLDNSKVEPNNPHKHPPKSLSSWFIQPVPTCLRHSTLREDSVPVQLTGVSFTALLTVSSQKYGSRKQNIPS